MNKTNAACLLYGPSTVSLKSIGQDTTQGARRTPNPRICIKQARRNRASISPNFLACAPSSGYSGRIVLNNVRTRCAETTATSRLMACTVAHSYAFKIMVVLLLSSSYDIGLRIVNDGLCASVRASQHRGQGIRSECERKIGTTQVRCASTTAKDATAMERLILSRRDESDIFRSDQC